MSYLAQAERLVNRIHIYQIHKIWFESVLWHINHCRLKRIWHYKYQILFIHVYQIYNIYKHIFSITSLNEPKLIVLLTVKRFQVLLYITNNSIRYRSFVYTVKWLNSFISNNRILSGATSPDQSGPGSRGYERILRIPQNSSITTCLTTRLFNIICKTLLWGGGLTLLQKSSRYILQPTRLYNARVIEFYRYF